MVFLGKPKSREDYDFVAKFSDELGPWISTGELCEEQTPYGAQAETGAKVSAPIDPNASSQEAAIRAHIDELLAAAGSSPTRLGWVLEQLRMYLSIPHHWR